MNDTIRWIIVMLFLGVILGNTIAIRSKFNDIKSANCSSSGIAVLTLDGSATTIPLCK